MMRLLKNPARLCLLVLMVLVTLFTLLIPASAANDEVELRRTSGQQSDDVFYRMSDDSWTMHTEMIAGGQAAPYFQYGCGMRFPDITIGQGREIYGAVLEFRADRTKTGLGCNTRISAEDVDDALTFADDYSAFVSRWNNRTTARVDYDDIEDWTGGGDYVSVDFKDVIQEIIDRDGWNSGNDIVIFWEDYDDRSPHLNYRNRYAESWDTDVSNAPELVITYAGDLQPDCPTGLIGEKVNIQDVKLSWNTANNSEYYTVTGSYEFIPSSNISGYLIYSGSDNWCLVEGLDINSTRYYFSLWNISSDNSSVCLEYIEIGGEDLELNIEGMTGIISLSAGMILLFINFFFKKGILYLAVIPCMVGCLVEPSFRNAWFQSGCVLVMIFAALAFFKSMSKGVEG